VQSELFSKKKSGRCFVRFGRQDADMKNNGSAVHLRALVGLI
jgi:hypothetical protein